MQPIEHQNLGRRIKATPNPDVVAERAAKDAAKRALTEARAERARAALKRWQSKLKRATTAVRKLKRTVKYYDSL